MKILLIFLISFNLFASRQFSREWYMEIAKKQIPGHSRISIQAFSTSVSTTSETLWSHTGNVPQPQATATTMTISSTDADDLNTTGTGARTVLLIGCDNAGLEATEIITMTGLTAVTTVNSYKHVNTMIVLSAGTTTQNEGSIYVGTGTVTSGVPAVVYNLITPLVSISQAGFYLVPSTVNLILVASIPTVGDGKVVELSFRSTSPTSGVVFAGSDSFVKDALAVNLNVPPPSIAGGTFIEIRTSVDSGTGEVGLTVSGVIVDNNLIGTEGATVDETPSASSSGF